MYFSCESLSIAHVSGSRIWTSRHQGSTNRKSESRNQISGIWSCVEETSIDLKYKFWYTSKWFRSSNYFIHSSLVLDISNYIISSITYSLLLYSLFSRAFNLLALSALPCLIFDSTVFGNCSQLGALLLIFAYLIKPIFKPFYSL